LIIYYIHGAGASFRSFNWLVQQLPTHTANFFEYDLTESLNSCIKRLAETITEPTLVIGHSLGGLIAAGVATQPNVTGIVTMCAPFGGLSSALVMAILSNTQLFRDLTPMNPALRNISNGLRESKKPHLPIVGTKGLPFTSHPNDGVVAVSSQMYVEKLDYKIINVNHFEILLAQETATLITDFIK
jgi:hypothetical protein